jgi:hypothetical protein
MLVVIGFLLIGGCSDSSQPVLSPIDSPTAGGTVQQGAVAKAVSGAKTQIPLPVPLVGKNKGGSSTGYITVSSGGQVSASYSYTSILNKLVQISATFSVPPGAIDKNINVTLSLDDKYVAVKFIPGGLKFKVPAKLTYNATGLDLSMVPVGAPISLCFVNDSEQVTEEENTESISTDPSCGSLACKNGDIPHFSRYAFAY